MRLEDKRQRSDTREIEGKENRGVVVREREKLGNPIKAKPLCTEVAG